MVYHRRDGHDQFLNYSSTFLQLLLGKDECAKNT